MPVLRNEDLILKSLDDTNETLQDLLANIHETQISFAELRVELNSLIGTVKELTKNLKFNDIKVAELNLKLALVEKSFTELDTKIKDLEKHNKDIELTDREGKWHTKAAWIGQLVTFVTALFALIHQFIH